MAPRSKKYEITQSFAPIATGFSWASVNNASGGGEIYLVPSDIDPTGTDYGEFAVAPGDSYNFTNITALGLWARTNSKTPVSITVDGG